MRNLVEYMPPFLKDVREFNKIFDAEDIEIQNLNTEMNLLLTEVIVKSATSFGLDRYEKIYGINNVSTNVEARRAAILTKINSRIPFTYKWLYYQLKENFGEDGFEINIDYDNYQIEIIIKSFSSEVADIFIESLYKKIPANLKQVFKLEVETGMNMGAVVVQKELDTLIIDNSVIEIEEKIESNANTGMTITQLEVDNLKIDTSVIEETESIETEENIGGTVIQKENATLSIDTSVIQESVSINNESYIGTSITQKENINLKEE